LAERLAKGARADPKILSWPFTVAGDDALRVMLSTVTLGIPGALKGEKVTPLIVGVAPRLKLKALAWKRDPVVATSLSLVMS
jgi:hypothetical protein